MKYLRKWVLPDLVVHRFEELEHPEDWGLNYFWYCRRCREVYAHAELFADNEFDANAKPWHPRIWHAVSGLCFNCPPDIWTIQGSLECLAFVGWHVPIEVAHYQLNREIAFLYHPSHPHNRDIA